MRGSAIGSLTSCSRCSCCKSSLFAVEDAIGQVLVKYIDQHVGWQIADQGKVHKLDSDPSSRPVRTEVGPVIGRISVASSLAMRWTCGACQMVTLHYPNVQSDVTASVQTPYCVGPAGSADLCLKSKRLCLGKS